MADFLLEIGTEELPAGYLGQALEQIKELWSSLLQEYRLSCDKFLVTGTPRRLVLSAEGLPSSQRDITREVTGPRTTVAFGPDGKPTEALLGFAKRFQVSLQSIQIKETDKGKICYVMVTTKGEKTEIVLGQIIPLLIHKISFPKSMWWATKSLTFARPIRYLMALLGKKALRISLGEIKSTNKTSGHHLLSPRPLTINSANFQAYQKQLDRAFVVVDHQERKNKITALINHTIKKYGSIYHPDELLDEVANLVEYPEILEGTFDEQFLKLPESVLETAMKSHQRYFPVRDKHGKLLHRFVVISNGGRDKSLIRIGNERVLKARLTDARFFWENDKKISLESRVENLKQMGYLGKLGSFYDKAERLKNIGSFINTELNYSHETEKVVTRAAYLCKADLLTEMVGEFPELQGVMGDEYARLQGEPTEVALAIKEHYQPRSITDAVPKSKPGIILSLAEKFDNISASFALGLEPTGSADPYAIRRQALGIIRIIEENCLNIPSLRKIISWTLGQVERTLRNLPTREQVQIFSTSVVADKIMAFFQERLFNKYLDQQYPYDLIQAVLASGFDNLLLFKMRLDEVVRLAKTQTWPDLVEVVERTYNIARSTKVSGLVEVEVLQDPDEKKLWEVYQKNKDGIQNLINQHKFYEASVLYARTFATPVHTFFEKVFVNVDDPRLRNNRMLLLKQINQLYSTHIADLSKVVTR